MGGRHSGEDLVERTFQVGDNFRVSKRLAIVNCIEDQGSQSVRVGRRTDHSEAGDRKAPHQRGLDAMLRNLDFMYADCQQKDFKINRDTLTSVLFIRKTIPAAACKMDCKGPGKEQRTCEVLSLGKNVANLSVRKRRCRQWKDLKSIKLGIAGIE